MTLPFHLIPHASELEKQIAAKVVECALNAGFPVSVYDGEETTVVRSIDPAVILPAMASTDEDVIRIHRPEGRHFAVWLIWGNSVDLISDYTDHADLEALLKPAFDLAEALDDRG